MAVTETGNRLDTDSDRSHSSDRDGERPTDQTQTKDLDQTERRHIQSDKQRQSVQTQHANRAGNMIMQTKQGDRARKQSMQRE